MPTFIFKHAEGGATIASTAYSLVAARNELAARQPDLACHDGRIWRPYECWEGGKRLWRMDRDGNCVTVPREETT